MTVGIQASWAFRGGATAPPVDSPPWSRFRSDERDVAASAGPKRSVESLAPSVLPSVIPNDEP